MDAVRPKQLKIVPYQAPGQAAEAGKKRKRRWAQVEGQNEPSLKIRNACIACREKKTRCSGHIPCVRCQQHGRQCQYMPTTASPHPSEKRDSIVNPAMSPVEAATIDSLDQQPSDGTQVPTFHDSSPTNPSSVNEGSGEPPDGPLQQDQYGHFHGGASEFAFLHMAKQKLASLPSMSIRFSDYPLAESGDFPPIVPPKPIADKLLRVFFDFGLTTSRFVHEPSLIESFEKLYSDGHGDALNDDSLALIYVVMTLGSHYSRVENMYCGYASSNIRFYLMADKQLQKNTSKITFASLQARMLATHYLLNHSRMHEAWSSFGIVVRHAQALGLHRRSVGPPSNHITHEYRKRLFWTIYVHDRIISSIFGRPCATHDDDIDQDECALANDEDITPTSCRATANGDFCSAAAMLYYARLSRILGSILRKFYSPVARNSNVLQLHQAATDFERSLIDWQDSLPAYLNYVALPPPALSTMTQRQTCTLKLMFAHASLLHYRPFILYSMNPSTSAISRLEQWVKRCHDKSIGAAKMVVNECRYLCQRGLFSRVFWLVNYMQFAAVGTLYMYSHLWPDATHVRDTAESAIAEFPVGVEGDLVGQRYVEILSELREVTAKSTAMQSVGIDLLARACTVDELPTFDDSLMDFGGSFSNLFFDTTAMDEYIVDHPR